MARRALFSSRRARLGCVVATMAGIATLATTAQPAAAEDPETPANSINISFRAPDEIAGSIDVRLLLGGVDITDASCGLLTPATPLAGPNRQCTGIADGTYAVDVVGQPDDALAVWSCTEIVATPAPHTAVPISADVFDEWGCFALVAQPGVLIDQFGEPEPAGVSTEVFDAAGTNITAACTPDVSNPIGKWCTGLDAGTYDVRATGVPDGYRASIECFVLGEFNVVEVTAMSGSFTVSAEQPLWECGTPFVTAPLAFGLFLQGGFGRDVSWLDDIAPVVTTSDGVDVSGACIVVGGSADDGFVSFDCPGLDDGTYSIAVSGAPEAFTTENTCTTIVVSADQSSEPSACDIFFVAEDILIDDGTIDDPPDADDEELDPAPVPTGQLPETGVPCNVFVLIGAALLIAGLALLGVGGRRRPPARVA